MYHGPMETVEYSWVNIWCMLLTLYTGYQLVASEKIGHCYIYLNWGSDTDWMYQYKTVKV